MANFEFTKNYNNRIYVLTKKYQRIYGFEIGTGKEETHNNESDAFKHTFMQADLALRYGDAISKIAGDFHEYRPKNNPIGEKNMDLWNNYQGRQIAKEIKKEYGKTFYELPESVQDDIIADKVVQKMRKGDLITHPSDKRKYTGFAADIESHSESECTGSYPVSGYTRSDGTKVSGYTRNCYKHNGKIPKLTDLSAEEIDWWVAKLI